MRSLLQDLRYAVRTLRKTPGFTIAAGLTLALGIGANAAIFSVVRGVLLAPLPFADPDRLVFLSEVALGGARMSVAVPNFQDWRERAQSFEGMAAFRADFFDLTGSDTPERLSGRMVTWDFFSLLGTQPRLGRAFTEADDRPGAAPTVVIGERLWHRRFGGDPAVLGRSAVLDGESFTIIGVVPAEFEFFRSDEVFVPFSLYLTRQYGYEDRGNHFGLFAIARLKPTTDLGAARAEMDGLAAQLREEYPATNSGNGARTIPLVDAMTQTARPTLLALLAGVGFVLLIACANVANLLLARAAGRGRELAVRMALGASRARILRQVLTECLLLFALGGTAGLMLGQWALEILLVLVPPGVPRLDSVRLDAPVLALTLGVSLLTGLIFGLLPALQAARCHPQVALHQVGRLSSGSTRRRTRQALLAAEVALALMLLTGAGLMVRTVVALARVDPGFRPANLLAGSFALPPARYPGDAQLQGFHRDCLARVEALPGVLSATLAGSLPVEGSNWNSVFVVGDQPVPERSQLPSAAFTPVSSGYFETLGIRLVRGRLFSEADDSQAPHVTLVNESLARRFWPGEDPIGKRLKQGWPEDETPWREVVGVVADVKFEGVNRDTPLQAYLPLAQEPTRSLSLVLRTGGDPVALTPTLARAVHQVDSDLPLFNLRTMEQALRGAVGWQRLAMSLLALFAGLAVLLAAVGVYGVVSFSVSQQSTDLAVRMAIGANHGQILRLVIGQGFRPTLVGMGLGLAGALVTSRLMSGLLFGVGPGDPLTYAGISLVLVAAALLASWIPARRATRVDPCVALRAE